MNLDDLGPYLRLALLLRDKPRLGGGNMFRHQVDTLGILLDYGHTDPVLLRAAVIHDLLEDLPGFDPARIRALPQGGEVLALVQEVSRQQGETKQAFLSRIRAEGSARARILKVADRLSNLTALPLAHDPDFSRRYIQETEEQICPLAEEVGEEMDRELRSLVRSRKEMAGPPLESGEAPQ